MAGVLLFSGIGSSSQISSTSPKPQNPLNAIQFDRFEKQFIYWISPTLNVEPTGTRLHDLHFLGKINSPADQAPFFLFSGLPCAGCADEKELYLISPKIGSSKAWVTPFVYPGKIIDPKKGGAVFDGRAFLGKCVHNRGEGYFVFQKERLDKKNRLRSSVFAAEPNGKFLSESLIESRRMPKIRETELLVKRKQCIEISGRNRMVKVKVRGIQPKPRLELDPDAEDDDNKRRENKSEIEAPPRN